MSKRDSIHELVKAALVNDGWVITDDPLRVEIGEGERGFEIDLGAEKVLLAERGLEKIAVEVKTFSAPTVLNAFHEALGQYLNYQLALTKNKSDRELFLAMSDEAFEKFKKTNFLLDSLKHFQLKTLIVDLENKKIVEWKK